MNTSSQPSQPDLRAHLLSLLGEFQPHHCGDDACPIYSLNQMPPMQRVAWLDALHQSELEYLASYHHVCLQTALQSNLTEVSALRAIHPQSGASLSERA